MSDSNDSLKNFWSLSTTDLCTSLQSSAQGLAASEAQARLTRYGANVLVNHRHAQAWRLFLEQFRSPLVLILLFASVVAALVRDWVDAIIVIAIVLISTVISFIQELRASRIVESLRATVAVRATVMRNGVAQQIPVSEVVPGDVVQLSAGSLIPADAVVLEARDLFVNEAMLTGESLPVEKYPGSVAVDTPLASRFNLLYYGTSVRSGTATALVVHSGQETVYGGIASRLELQAPETEFERGLRQFGVLLVWFMIVMVLVVLAINLLFSRPVVETLLFALALAVGLSPELLPAILGITLARGARDMAKSGVIVKRLNAIENFGGMSVLCTDKTGTLTEGVMALDNALDVEGIPSVRVLQQAVLNASFETGLVNPLDAAIVEHAKSHGMASDGWRKLDEIPYDFVRKRLTIVVAQPVENEALLITKGALHNVLDVCTRVRLGDGDTILNETARQGIEQHFAAWSEQGYRVLGLASKQLDVRKAYQRSDERDLFFEGFLLFSDPPKAGIRETLVALRELGVQVKIITGDNLLVARHVARSVGIRTDRVMTGAEMDRTHDEAMWHLAEEIDLFAEVDPNQKERILRALQKSGHVVGFLGDGINDAPALFVADVGISVDGAVDVAREAADFVLLEHNLEVLRQGIEEGRATFANTMKYIFVTTSANFGNMVSMSIASLFLPFLPLLAKQILLNNFISDFPSMGIASDRVDREWKITPHRWDMKAVRRFMVIFGLISTLFDLLTFAVLWWLAQADPELFRTGWFVESLLTELLIIFVLRTYRPFYLSPPGLFMLLASIGAIALTVALPFLSIGVLFDFVALPSGLLGAIIVITLIYVVVCEMVKRWLYRDVAAA